MTVLKLLVPLKGEMPSRSEGVSTRFVKHEFTMPRERSVNAGALRNSGDPAGSAGDGGAVNCPRAEPKVHGAFMRHRLNSRADDGVTPLLETQLRSYPSMPTMARIRLDPNDDVRRVPRRSSPRNRRVKP